MESYSLSPFGVMMPLRFIPVGAWNKSFFFGAEQYFIRAGTTICAFIPPLKDTWVVSSLE